MIIEGLNKFFVPLLFENASYTPWYRLPQAIKWVMNKYQGISYNLVYSETEPTVDPWSLVEDQKYVRVGTACGKGYGVTSGDSGIAQTFRSGRRSGTTQPKDRLRDHLQLIVEGPACVLARKNYEGQGRAWTPFWAEHGFGDETAQNVWVSLAVPHTDKPFNEQTLLLEMVELGTIAKHIDIHGDSPITDLKYRSKSQEEIYGKLRETSGRFAKINKDSSYDNKKTDNYLADPYSHFTKLCVWK